MTDTFRHNYGKLNDLNIVPPTKYFGMVKIKDEVIVKFGLGLTSQNYARK